MLTQRLSHYLILWQILHFHAILLLEDTVQVSAHVILTEIFGSSASKLRLHKTQALT